MTIALPRPPVAHYVIAEVFDNYLVLQIFILCRDMNFASARDAFLIGNSRIIRPASD
jgi:hypothetical protein